MENRVLVLGTADSPRAAVTGAATPPASSGAGGLSWGSAWGRVVSALRRGLSAMRSPAPAASENPGVTSGPAPITGARSSTGGALPSDWIERRAIRKANRNRKAAAIYAATHKALCSEGRNAHRPG